MENNLTPASINSPSSMNTPSYSNSVVNAANNSVVNAANNSVFNAANNSVVSAANNSVVSAANNSVVSAANNSVVSAANSIRSPIKSIKSVSKKIKDTVTESGSVNLLMIVILIFVLALIAYFVSKSYRIGSTYENLKIYDSYIFLSSNYLKNEKLQDQPLKNFYVASAFRPYMAINQYFDYTSTKLLQKVIMSGARFIYMDVYNSNLKFNPSPVVSNGFQKGNWKLTLNTTTFDEMCKVIAITAFDAGYCNNYSDPFILALNLNVNNNIICLNKIRNSIYHHFKYTLLPPEFSNLQKDLANTAISKFMGKLILLTSDGYQNSELKELINGSWEDRSKINLINSAALDPKATGDNTIKLKNEQVIKYNKNALTIVTPNIYDFFTRNYDSQYQFNAGCQFICMNYQKKENISEYISIFKNSSFVLKPKNLI